MEEVPLLQEKIEHTTSSLQKPYHVCIDEGCQSVTSYRQSQRISIIKDIEDQLIKQFQAMFNIRNLEFEEKDEESKLQEYYFRMTHILYKYGTLAVWQDSNKNLVFGYMGQIWYNAVGDAIKYDIYIHRFGNLITGVNDIYVWDVIKNNTFYVFLPRRKGLAEQYSRLIKYANDSFDNLRIDQDNSMIKYYFDAGTIPEGWKLKVSTTPSVDNMGIAVVTSQLIPANGNNVKTSQDKMEDVKNFLMNNEGKGLIKNDYQSTLQLSINNMTYSWKLLCMFSGLRENKEIKKANQTEKEVEYSNFSYDVGENFVLQSIKKLVRESNKMFGEQNYIEKVAEIIQRDDDKSTLNQPREFGLDDVIINQNNTNNE